MQFLKDTEQVEKFLKTSFPADRNALSLLLLKQTVVDELLICRGMATCMKRQERGTLRKEIKFAEEVLSSIEKEIAQGS